MSDATLAAPATDLPDPRWLADLARRQALAWVVCTGAATGPHATPLPLRLIGGDDGAPVALEGHFARRNPQVDALRRDPQALVLWTGPQAYVSPAWMGDRQQAPTWYSAAAQARVRVQFDDRPDAALAHLDALCAEHEAARGPAGGPPWQPAEMGERLARLARGVVPFRAEVLDWAPRGLLGGGDRDDVLAAVCRALHEQGLDELLHWVRRHNAGRPAATAPV